jgi:hypothetical protein
VLPMREGVHIVALVRGVDLYHNWFKPVLFETFSYLRVPK